MNAFIHSLNKGFIESVTELNHVGCRVFGYIKMVAVHMMSIYCFLSKGKIKLFEFPRQKGILVLVALPTLP